MTKRTSTRRDETAEESLYETDFNAWTRRTAELLRAGRLAQVDLDHAAEEIGDMGKRDAKEAHSRMRILIMHLLEWQVQPELRSRSWRATIHVQRREIADLLEQSPSLRRLLGPRLARTYGDAVEDAMLETGYLREQFPPSCP